MAIAPIFNAPEPILNLCPNLVGKEIEYSIQQSKHWQHVARVTKKVAIWTIAAAIALSALLLSSPVLPIIGAFALLCLAGYEGRYHVIYYTPLNSLAILITASTTLSLKLGQYLYTNEVIRIVLIANTIIASPGLCIFLGAEVLDLFLEKKIDWLTELKNEINKMDIDPSYTPSEKTCQKLLPLYKNLYIRQFSKGFLKALPTKIEKQLDILYDSLVDPEEARI